MHRTRKSPLRSSSERRTRSRNPTSFACSTASPVRMGVEVEAGHAQPAVGLGIFQGGEQVPFSQLRIDRSMQPPLQDWPTPTISNQTYPDPTLTASAYPAVPSYQSYDDYSPLHPSLVGFSGIAPHDIVSPMSYSPDLQAKDSDLTAYGRNPGLWAMTPQSQESTSSSIQMREGQSVSAVWPVPVSSAPFYSNAWSEPQEAQHFTQTSQFGVDELALDSHPAEAYRGDTLLEVDVNHQSPVDDSTSPEASPKKETSKGSRRSLSPLNIGFRCTICDTQFTRRSNCREHMKRHDPNHRRDHSCVDCGKSFGRKTDLKRHSMSIHEGAKRFCCDQCGHCYSRQDTLYRHRTDGCRKRKRNIPKSQGPAMMTGAVQPYPSPQSVVERSRPGSSPVLHNYSV